MQRCPSCGKENPEGFRYCGFCTAVLPELDGEPEGERSSASFSAISLDSPLVPTALIRRTSELPPGPTTSR
jgi:hypothetical protein